MFRKLLLLIVFSASLFTPNSIFAEGTAISKTLEGKVVGIVEEKEITTGTEERNQLYQKLEIEVSKGQADKGTIIVESGLVPSSGLPRYEVGDRVVIFSDTDPAGNIIYTITDYVRRDKLLILFAIFVVLTSLIAGVKGFLSLLGMGISFLVILLFILPKILSGSNPVDIAIIGSLIIIPPTFILSHGANKKTLTAIIGTLIALVITGLLASLFVNLANLTGFSSEEASFLQSAKGNLVNIKGLLLAGIIIGVLGVLDDITISQAAVVFQLKEANSKLKIGKLFAMAMNVGKDHISSMVNTLVLVYTGASLPLLLLFIDNPHPFTEIINYEIVADEIVRTLVGSIGLILAVPITTIIAAVMVEETNR